MEPKVTAAAAGAVTAQTIGLVLMWITAQLGLELDEATAGAVGAIVLVALGAIGAWTGGYLKPSPTSVVSDGFRPDIAVAELNGSERGTLQLALSNAGPAVPYQRPSPDTDGAR